jgi:hypothetical protein
MAVEQVDSALGRALRQQRRIRQALDEGASLALPKDWPSFKAVDWHQAIATLETSGWLPNQSHSTIFVISLRALKHLGPFQSLRTLLKVIASPPRAAAAEAFRTEVREFPVGGYTVRFWGARLTEAVTGERR